MTTTQTQRVTAGDLLQMPDDGFRYELVRGELKKMAPAGREHGKLALKLGSLLLRYVESHGLGEVYAAETGFKIRSDPDTVRAPDVAFLSQARAEELADTKGYIPGVPNLAIEVISPSDTYSEVEGKVFEWLEAGAQQVIVVDPRRRTVTVYRSRHDISILTETDTLDGGKVVPGWSLAISELFS